MARGGRIVGSKKETSKPGNGNFHAVRGARIVWPISGSRGADRRRRTMVRGSMNRRYLSSVKFWGRVRRGSGPDRSSVYSFWL